MIKTLEDYNLKIHHKVHLDSELNRFEKYLDLIEKQIEDFEKLGNDNLVESLCNIYNYYNVKRITVALELNTIEKSLLMFELDATLPF